VTGQTYPNTAIVSFKQPFADGSVVEDVVRLVQDDKGEWRWFFGRSREFVDAQIATYALATPQPASPRSTVEVAMDDLNSSWNVVFHAARRAYAAPQVIALDTPRNSPCGDVDAESTPAAYCPIDGTIYFATAFFTEQKTRFGDYAWINILAHEWGHHAQNTLGITTGTGNAFELQADCLAGVYARDASTRGLLEPGDVTSAVLVSAEHGDDPLWSQDQPGAHGTNDDRISAFMRGFLDSLRGCELPIAIAAPA
jgi:predicted metalloprotease